jgi:hypothetical protein
MRPEIVSAPARVALVSPLQRIWRPGRRIRVEPRAQVDTSLRAS